MNKRLQRALLAAISTTLTGPLGSTESHGSTDDGFSRYQIIISRKPFGKPPPAPAKKEEPPKKQEDSFAKTMRVCGISKLANGLLEAGIWDEATKKYFLLMEGESSDDGLKVVSVNYDLEQVPLDKAGETAVVTLTNQVAKATGNPKVRAKPTGKGTAKGTALAKETASKASDYRARREERRKKKLAKLAEIREARRLKDEALKNQARYTQEELRAHLQNYNEEVIKQGLPPLPIELTKEQDDRLVQEGYLPPQSGQEHLLQPGAAAGGNNTPELPKQIGQIQMGDLTAEELRALESLGLIQ